MEVERSHAVPFGTWPSPLSAASVAAGTLRLSGVQVDGHDIYWLEGRASEGGRYVLVRWRDGSAADVVPRDFNVRTRVHEYGGGAYLVRDGVAYCVNFVDQRVYRIRTSGSLPESASVPEPLTPVGAWRYADFELDARRARLICVREDHTPTGSEPINTLVSIPLSTDRQVEADLQAGAHADVLASGRDFYSTPRLSPDGSRLAWLSWRHPAMPWDGTELWLASLDGSGTIRDAACVAGGAEESIYQPGWSPDGALYYASDRTGWWTLYRADGSTGPDRHHPVVVNLPIEAEFGRPQWVFGTATWACASASRLVVSFAQQGRWRLAVVDVASGTLTELAPELQPHDWLAAAGSHAVLVAGFETKPDAVVRVELSSGHVSTIRAASSLLVDAKHLSRPESVQFHTTGGEPAHAFYYAPKNDELSGLPGEAPPLIVITHGGPTAAAEPTLHFEIQYWTSRGFAVVDVNYRGTTGYGRAYRERLNGRWGIVDVEDVINAARHLSDTGRADASRLVIRGGSAGGYTALAALTFHPAVFKAGASYYGISDLEVLEIDTHKFESRYSHSLVGPYPEARALYRERSPIHAIDRLACPLILFQGLEDKVVPPNQSEMMADAVRAKGLPVAYLAFEGEQHGFRKAENIKRCLEAELYFYGKVFGFLPADSIEPVHIDNLQSAC